jgi:beta-lactamase superfamily II metal-dependent hydrolase
MYDGLEIDMLAVGNADAILLTAWNGDSEFRTLVDGGNKKDWQETVKPFLLAQNVKHLHAVVSTHPHDDHAGGLLELANDRSISIGHAYLHLPQNHLDMGRVDTTLRKSTTQLARILEKSLETSKDLYSALKTRGIGITEPFDDVRIGTFKVVGPTVNLYTSAVHLFTDIGEIFAQQSAFDSYNLATRIEAMLTKSEDGPGLLENPQTEPENNSSVILGSGAYKGGTILLTADAGVAALTDVKSRYQVGNLGFMQIPHHGSRRNITAELINYFAPRIAYVSAEGSSKHPRRSVVNAFKGAGSRVYGTHYPEPGSLRHQRGTVPARGGYSAATPLWDTRKEPEKKVPEPLWKAIGG